MPCPCPAEKRFWTKVEIGSANACWLWTAGKNAHGYGRISVGRKAVLAHRFAYELTYGKVPADMHVRHACDNPSCVNPAHLSIGTHQENMKDMVVRGRQQRVAGTRKWSAKLTEADVELIRSRIADGATVVSMARAYGMHHSSIYRIRDRKNWK